MLYSKLYTENKILNDDNSDVNVDFNFNIRGL